MYRIFEKTEFFLKKLFWFIIFFLKVFEQKFFKIRKEVIGDLIFCLKIFEKNIFRFFFS